jgi:signal transduction histidine kinase
MEFVHPDDRERSEEESRRVFAGETVRAFENRVLCRDGSHKWIEWTATPVTQGRVIYAVGRDVTERHRRETEQAALQRVATLVAQEASQADVLGAIAEEIGGIVGAEEVRMLRFDSDTSAVVVGGSGRLEAFPLGSHQHLDGDSVALRVLRTRRPARLDDYGVATGTFAEKARSIGVRAVVGVPVFVERRLWGAISAGSTHDGPLPPDTEARLDQFTKLMATAIANAEARAEVHRLAEEQAALRRVAVLVAEQPSPTEVFTAVTREVGLLLEADLAVLHVFPGDGTATTIASWSGDGPSLPIGTRFPLDRDNLAGRIFETVAPARMHSDDEAWEREATDLSRRLRLRSAVGAPLLVKGKIWGALMAATRAVEPWAENAESRIAAFTELVATAIANAESSAELAASRRRIVAAADDARRRIERDLHDGVQQQLVTLGLELGAMEAGVQAGETPSEQLTSVSDDVRSILESLREIARGIHPAILSQGGLGPALRSLTRRSAVPVELDAQIEGALPDEVETAVFYSASEALTNVAKHARASVVHMHVTTDDGNLKLVVRDDGVGGANLSHGSGLVGLHDRVEALGGTITIDSSAGSGTCVAVTLPIAAEPDPGEISSVRHTR